MMMIYEFAKIMQEIQNENEIPVFMGMTCERISKFEHLKSMNERNDE